jgi:hypothetical protein
MFNRGSERKKVIIILIIGLFIILYAGNVVAETKHQPCIYLKQKVARSEFNQGVLICSSGIYAEPMG